MSADSLSEFVGSVKRVRKSFLKKKSTQIRNSEDKELIQALVNTWVRSVKPSLNPNGDFKSLDELFGSLYSASVRDTSCKRYLVLLSQAFDELVSAKEKSVSGAFPLIPYSEAPDFSKISNDKRMQSILSRRWDEIEKCVGNDVRTASMVLMGSMLEALILAKINNIQDKASIFKLKKTPIDQKSGKAKDIRDWTLTNYIDVAHELGWIRPLTKDLSVVIKDYRNYIHPAKEYSHGLVIEGEDINLMWKIFQEIVTQIIGK